MVFDDDDQNPYEFIWFLRMMIRISMNLYVVEDDDDQKPYEFMGLEQSLLLEKATL